MYTVMITDDGMFTAEYVQPPALSIPLGISGSSVQVRRNEDLTFSAMIDGEWMVITAETTVTAANGNVYAAVLSPEGVPIGVMHVAAMQEVMLGELGGTVTVTQAEDMTWWIGEMEVKTGQIYTAANGNDYMLMQDAEGMWSAMYQKVMVMVDLGTQGAIELVRAEDMSWWLGSEAVGVGSEVMSDNGNTYTLWYTDGVWTARFEPESMMIEGTGLVAMTREADDMYDVGDAMLPATGMGDVTVDGAMYHVWKQDGMLMGARFDAAIDTDTDYKIGTIGLPTLSANDPDMPGTELRSYLIVTGDDDSGMGMFSIGDLLGSGMASDEGSNFVYEAVKAIKKVEADVSALLALDTKPSGLDTILEGQWTKLEAALDTIFGTNSGAETDPTSAVRTTAPREEDILDDIADILDALSSEEAFVAATAEDGDGVFESQALGAGAAANAFNRLMWTADATMGMTGSTRYGTAARKTSANAKKGSSVSEYGAFSYSTMQQTVRTMDAASISLTGIASYMGGTHAVNSSGDVYTGTMELQVRFNANSVSGVVSGLQDSEGLAWQHNFADVDRIVLDDGTLRRNAKWTHTGTAGSSATVFYTRDSGLLRPVSGITNTFDGILLGQGAAAGSEANGTWSVGTAGGSTYLAGGFGVQHVADTARPVPGEDDGSKATAMLFTMAADTNAAINMTSQSIGDGMLTVKQRSYGYRDATADGTQTYGALSEAYGGTEDAADDTGPTLLTAKFDLAELTELGGGVQKVVNGATWLSQVISILTTERNLLSTLQGLDSADTQSAEIAAWQRVQAALQYRMLGNLPMKMDDNYPGTTGGVTNFIESEADAIDLINRALDALSSNTNLGAALDPDGTGIFDHYDSGTADDTATPDVREDQSNFVNAAKEKVNNRTFAQMRGEKMHQVFATLGSTSYTRFGVWRRQSTQNAIREGGVIKSHGGPGTFAYSPLDPTNAGTPANTGFPQGGSATYEGETVALQNTTWLTGTVRVDVTWTGDADSGTAGTFDADLGDMSVTLTGLASAAGDPLTYGGAPKATGTNLENNPTATGGAGTEIADIVLGNFNILVGGQGDNMGHLLVGTAGTPDANGDIAYTEAAPSTAGRLRFTALGMVDNTTVPDTTDTGVKALFVGQGVDGPLGVIGTYTINAGTEVTPGNVTAVTSTSIGRLGADGTQSVDVGVTIYGAFGAQVP